MKTDKGTRGGSDYEPENPLGVCAAMLARRDFTTCREFAHRFPRTDPYISDCVDRILAIIDVLCAAERRLNKDHFDWYSILQLRREDAGNRELARRQFKKLVLFLDPTKNKFPFSDDALMRVREAWSVLSDPERRAIYEREIDNPWRQEPCNHSGRGDAPNKGRNDNEGDLKVTFWTLCPYCWNLYEYENKYEDCSLRCENCRRTFHGVAVKSPVKEMVAEGEQQYYCYQASIPLMYPVSGVMEEERGMEDENMGEQNFVYISDDDVGDSSKKCGIREREGNFQAESVGGSAVREELEKKVGDGTQGNVRNEECLWKNGKMELQNNGKRRMRIKTVAKKIVGNRLRSQGCLDGNSDSDLGAEDGELEFTPGDGDIFVGVRFTK